MKYKELEKILKKKGCYFLKNSKNGHPIWFSPITKKKFKMSNHSSEVRNGTLKSILRDSGV